ncbi:MAG: hypothetical protein ACLU9L_04320 [Christensenellales bacterium]
MAEQTKKAWYKKWWVWVIIAVIVFASIPAILPANTEYPIRDNGSMPEKNTSAMVDYIASQAKEDANQFNANHKKSALHFINENREDFFKDNETMETGIYYGFLLEYAYENDTLNKAYYQCGMDLEQAIKYVYRGAESKDSESVLENLRQVDKSLEEINK